MSNHKNPYKKDGKGRISRKEIAAQLITALPSLKEILGEKKFERRVKKAAKQLTAGIKFKAPKKEKSKKTELKQPVKVEQAKEGIE